ncbi:MAG TPA: porin family protein [Bacteroidaceae bacterium]|nr:porin family protein [Bacteroidaceae bacterium]
MKKYTIYVGVVLALLFAGVSTAHAQVGKPLNLWTAGINVGLNRNNMEFQPEIKTGNFSKMHFGLTGRYIHENYFSMISGIQLELNYSQRGWAEKFDGDGDMRSYSHTLNYIEVPLLAHLGFGHETGNQFFLHLGPQFGFLVSESSDFGGEGWTDDLKDSDNYREKVDNTFNYGIVGGAGVELKTKMGHFLLEGRYYYSLADIYSNAKKEYFDRSAPTTVEITFTYLIDL